MNFLKIFNKNRTEIKMVQDDDLVGYLISLGIYQDILAQKIHCRFCGLTITLENLQALFPCDEKVCIICSSANCMGKLQHGQ